MNKYFDIKRTKMIDEAAFNHRPTTVLRSLLIFMAVFIIGSILTGIIESFFLIPYVLKELSNIDILNMSTEEILNYTNGITEKFPSWIDLVMLFANVVIILTCIFYCKKFEKRDIRSMGFRKCNVAKEYGIGALLGAFAFALTFLLLLAFGTVKTSLNKNINFGMIILFLLGYIVQGCAEEVLLRGYLMTSLARDNSPILAIIISSLAFSLMHFGNNGYGIVAFLNVFLFGFIMGVYVFKRGSIWGACAIHSLWNFVQGNIFGTSVSGLNLTSSVLESSMEVKVPFISSKFGPEGTVACTIVLLIGAVLVLLLKESKSELSLSEITSQNTIS